jgi:hypothetical protein
MKLTLEKNGFERAFENSLTMQAAFRSWFTRILQPMYINFQKQRWITGGSSEGTPWKSLSEAWISRKEALRLRDPNSFPGGNKTMVFTNSLFMGVSLQDLSYGSAIATDKTWIVALNMDAAVPSPGKAPKKLGEYAKYANDARPYKGLGDASMATIKAELAAFVKRRMKGRE